MSVTTDRLELAEILSTVDGVHGFEFRPATFGTGDAWPQIGPLERGPANNFLVTWRVTIVLPANERKASSWFTDHIEDLTDALDQFAYVERIEPFILQTEAGDANAILLTMNKEA